MTSLPDGTRWFRRNHVGRPLTALEAEFVASLAHMLDDLSPAQVDPAETALTAEASECLICLIPHRTLGGLSVVATLAGQHVSVSWAQVSDLSWHDELDLAHQVSSHEISEGAVEPGVSGVRDQLRAPIVIRARTARDGSRTFAECQVRDARGRSRRVAWLGAWPTWFTRLWRRDRIQETEVRFVDPHPPPFGDPSGASKWFERLASSA